MPKIVVSYRRADTGPIAGRIFDRLGEMPLPPYVAREAESADRDRYQTVYAREPGAVAAPTAGLHFTSELLDVIRARGVDVQFITLHVGLSTALLALLGYHVFISYAYE